MVAMVPHQHLTVSRKRKSDTEGRLFVNWIPTSEDLKNVFMEEWISASGDAPGEQETTDAL